MSESIQPGFRFKEGKLYIFEPGRIMLLHAWPKLEAVRKGAGYGEWKPFSPDFRVVAPYRSSAKREKQEQMTLDLGAVESKPTLADLRKQAFDAFRFAMPKEVAARVERFQNLQWRVLKLMAAEPRAVDVCKANPALVFCLANARAVYALHISLCDLERWILRRQRDLVHLLRLDPTESNARILGKVVPESVSADSMRLLLAFLRRSSVAKVLSHLRRINVGVIALASDPDLRVRCTPALLDEVSQEPAEKFRGVTARQLEDLDTMAEQLGQPIRCQPYASRAEVESEHNRLSVQYAQSEMLRATGIRFHSPPVPGTAHIIPLRTPEELVEEGREQENCVASYVQAVLEGHTYIYRVLAPERATLSLTRDSLGNWAINQLESRRNHGVQHGTLEAVQAWLEAYSPSAC
jgi:hypothetical protein